MSNLDAALIEYLEVLHSRKALVDSDDGPRLRPRQETLFCRDLLICMDVLRAVADDGLAVVQAIEVVANRFFVSFSTARRAYYAMRDEPLVHKWIIYGIR